MRSVHLKRISQLPLPMISLWSRAVLDFKPVFLMDVNPVSLLDQTTVGPK